MLILNKSRNIKLKLYLLEIKTYFCYVCFQSFSVQAYEFKNKTKPEIKWYYIFYFIYLNENLNILDWPKTMFRFTSCLMWKSNWREQSPFYHFSLPLCTTLPIKTYIICILPVRTSNYSGYTNCKYSGGKKLKQTFKTTHKSTIFLEGRW